MSFSGVNSSIEKYTDESGRSWFIKRNQSAGLTDIEARIYAAAHDDIKLSQLGCKMPVVKRSSQDPCALFIEDRGDSLENMFYGSGDSDHRSERFSDVVKIVAGYRHRLNDVIGEVLTDQDKEFLQDMQDRKILERMRKVAPDDCSITLGDIKEHYWAYRVMASMDFYDRRFKEDFTEVYGKVIDRLIPKFGGWLSDNCLRNNLFDLDLSIAPIDFNSIHYGLRQMDDVPLVGLDLFVLNADCAKEILGNFDELKDFFEERLADTFGRGSEDFDEDYLAAFIVSNIIQNARLAGYRAKELGVFSKRIDDAYKIKDDGSQDTKTPLDSADIPCLDHDLVHGFCKAFKESEFHYGAVAYSMLYLGELVPGRVALNDKILDIHTKIKEMTFGVQFSMMLRPWFFDVLAEFEKTGSFMIDRDSLDFRD
jgi:hypothetical protein